VTLSSSKDTGRSNLLWIADLEESKVGSEMKWHKVINEWGDYWADIGNDGSLFYFFTKCVASAFALLHKLTSSSLPQRQRLAQLQDRHIRLRAPREGELSRTGGSSVVLTLDSQQGFTDLIPHNPDALLSSVHIANNDALILLYSVDVKDELYLHELKSGKRVKRLAEGLIGSIDQIAGRREHDEFWFSVTSFTTPGTVYRYDFKAAENQEESVYRVAKVAGIDPEQFASEQGESPARA